MDCKGSCVPDSGPPSGIRVTVPLPIQKGMDCKGSCVPDSGPPSGIRITVPLPIQKGMDCKGSCVPDSGPPSGIRVTVFRGRIDCCDLMNVLYKGQVLQTAIIVRGKYSLLCKISV